MLDGKKALLLDMNSTFMFGEDRFGEAEDFWWAGLCIRTRWAVLKACWSYAKLYRSNERKSRVGYS